MQIESIPDSNTNFSLVFLKDTGKYIKNLTPHCKKHGAMNKVSIFEKEGLLPYLNKDRKWIQDPNTLLHRPRQIGGYWRCLQENCRAGCQQITE